MWRLSLIALPLLKPNKLEVDPPLPVRKRFLKENQTVSLGSSWSSRASSRVSQGKSRPNWPNDTERESVCHLLFFRLTHHAYFASRSFLSISFLNRVPPDHYSRSCSAITGAPSGVTSYVIVGDQAGPSKLKKIEQLKVKMLDEDGFLNLIATRGSAPLDAKTKKKLADEEAKIKQVAKNLAAKEKEEEKDRVAAEKKGGAVK